MDIDIWIIAGGVVAWIVLKTVWVATSIGKVTFLELIRGRGSLVGFTAAGLWFLNTIGGLYWQWPSIKWGTALQVIGVVVGIVGLGIAVWAKIVMGSNWNIPGVFDKDKQKELVIQGPFKYGRNPIYLGLLFMEFGYGLALQTWCLALVVPFYLLIKSNVLKEEKLLEAHFGESYQEYKSRTPRFV